MKFKINIVLVNLTGVHFKWEEARKQASRFPLINDALSYVYLAFRLFSTNVGRVIESLVTLPPLDDDDDVMLSNQSRSSVWSLL